MSLGFSLELVELLQESLLLPLIFSQLMPERINVQLSGDDLVLIDGIGRWFIDNESSRPELLLRRNLR